MIYNYYYQVGPTYLSIFVQYLNTFHTVGICKGFKYFHQVFITTLALLVDE